METQKPKRKKRSLEEAAEIFRRLTGKYPSFIQSPSQILREQDAAVKLNIGTGQASPADSAYARSRGFIRPESLPQPTATERSALRIGHQKYDKSTLDYMKMMFGEKEKIKPYPESVLATSDSLRVGLKKQPTKEKAQRGFTERGFVYGREINKNLNELKKYLGLKDTQEYTWNVENVLEAVQTGDIPQTDPVVMNFLRNIQAYQDSSLILQVATPADMKRKSKAVPGLIKKLEDALDGYNYWYSANPEIADQWLKNNFGMTIDELQRRLNELR